VVKDQQENNSFRQKIRAALGSPNRNGAVNQRRSYCALYKSRPAQWESLLARCIGYLALASASLGGGGFKPTVSIRIFI
jgi:hypothetical protein